MVERPEVPASPGDPAPSALHRQEIRQIFLYFALLALLLGLGNGLSGLPVVFYLKEKLQMGPQALARFSALASIPSYIGFLFGYLRDRWRPFGKGDRGYMLLTMPVIACLNLYLSFGDLTYTRILWVALASGIIGGMLGAAISGLKVAVAQKHLMTGRLVALGGIIGVVPGILSSLAGGWLTHHVPTSLVFRLCAGLYYLVTFFALWRPAAVFEGQSERRPSTKEGNFAAVKRMLRHRPFWPALVIILLWVFAPGWGTPLFFYLTEKLKITPEQYGVISASGIAVTAVVSVLYGILCRRMPLKRLLWWGTILGTIAGPAYLLIHGFGQAIAISILVSLLLGITNASFGDLLMRSYPKGLEGTGDTLVGSFAAGVAVGSDLFGSWLYEKGGFGLALGITTLFSALIVPVLFLLPRALISTRDGETNREAAES
ncbi:MAG TPA: MFS transporter, partial [Chthonomonadaceae bacterium]|nr:MFS transporter [Chthonomonadaceae bacterium]